jgi:hypothetical protein
VIAAAGGLLAFRRRTFPTRTPVRELWGHWGELAEVLTFKLLYRLEIRPAAEPALVG